MQLFNLGPSAILETQKQQACHKHILQEIMYAYKIPKHNILILSRKKHINRLLSKIIFKFACLLLILNLLSFLKIFINNFFNINDFDQEKIKEVCIKSYCNHYKF